MPHGGEHREVGTCGETCQKTPNGSDESVRGPIRCNACSVNLEEDRQFAPTMGSHYNNVYSYYLGQTSERRRSCSPHKFIDTSVKGTSGKADQSRALAVYVLTLPSPLPEPTKY